MFVALLLHPPIQVAAHFGTAVGVFRIGSEVVEFIGVGSEVVEFFGGTGGETLHRRRRGWIVFGGGEPSLPIGESAGTGGARDVRVMLELGVEIADVFPVAGADGANRVDIEVAIAAMGGEDLVAMLGCGAAKDAGKGLAIDTIGYLAAAEFDESWQQIGPADHGVGGSGGLQSAGPGDEEWDADACVVEVPFGKGPLAAVVCGVDEKGVTGDFFVSECSDFAEKRVGMGDIGEVSCPLCARDGSVHMSGWDLDAGWIVGW